MNLVTILNNRSIAGIQEGELKSILEGTHPSISVRMASNGMVMLSNNTVIKCVENYYRNPNSHVDMKKHNNMTAKCYYVIEDLGLDGVSVNHCAQCHLRCLNKKGNKELQRIYK